MEFKLHEFKFDLNEIKCEWEKMKRKALYIAIGDFSIVRFRFFNSKACLLGYFQDFHFQLQSFQYRIFGSILRIIPITILSITIINRVILVISIFDNNSNSLNTKHPS